MLTVLGVLWSAPAIAGASTSSAGGNTARDQEWWLAGLHITQVWPASEGAGIIVAVLGTGVDASYPGLAGSVITGPDYTGSGRGPGSPYWGGEGTAVAGIIAAHDRDPGIVGVAPAAKILSVRVTLEFNDPLVSDQAISQRLPQAVADGIRYAADHGARIIDLPLDPGTLGLTSKGDPAAAGGSQAERAAVDYALGKGIVLVAPAGDDGEGAEIMNYPAAYPGVIAVGAIARNGQLGAFSSRRSYASVTAPGVSVVAATPPDGSGTTSSTSTASGVVAGIAALILSKFPHFTVAQVTQTLIESTAATAAGHGLPTLPARSPAGAGYGTVDAARALDLAAVISAANQPHQLAPAAAPRRPVRHLIASPVRPAASTLAGSVLRDAVAGVGVLIVLLVVALLVVRSRGNRGRRGAADRARTRGQHESRGPAPLVAVAADTTATAAARTSRRAPPASSPSSAGWTSAGGWQGGGIGEIRPGPDTSYRPAVAAVPKSSGYRTGRGARRPDGSSGPPWAPAPEPERLIGPLPVTSVGLPPPEPGRGIRVPGDMAAPPGAATDPSPPVSFDLTTPPADFDLSTPAFGLTPPAFDAASPASEAEALTPEAEVPAADPPDAQTGILPARESLGFAAAPVPADYAAPSGPETAVAADPSYIWDLAATDVFPVATEADAPQDEAPEAGQA